MKRIFIIPIIVFALVFTAAGFALAQENEPETPQEELAHIVSSVIDMHEDEDTEWSQEDIVDELLDVYISYTEVEEDEEDEEDDEDEEDEEADDQLANENSVRDKVRMLNFGQFRKALRNGTEGEEVLALQEALNDLADDIGVDFDIKEDGLYGPNTARLVRLFQTHRGIQTDGVAGPQTLEHLKSFFGVDDDDDDTDDTDTDDDDDDDDDTDDDDDDTQA